MTSRGSQAVESKGLAVWLIARREVASGDDKLMPHAQARADREAEEERKMRMDESPAQTRRRIARLVAQRDADRAKRRQSQIRASDAASLIDLPKMVPVEADADDKIHSDSANESDAASKAIVAARRLSVASPRRSHVAVAAAPIESSSDDDDTLQHMKPSRKHRVRPSRHSKQSININALEEAQNAVRQSAIRREERLDGQRFFAPITIRTADEDSKSHGASAALSPSSATRESAASLEQRRLAQERQRRQASIELSRDLAAAAAADAIARAEESDDTVGVIPIMTKSQAIVQASKTKQVQSDRKLRRLID